MKKYKRVYIEITNVCNLSCSFCPLTKREKKFLTKEDFNHILKQVKPYTDYIYLHLMGEPLINPNLESFLELAYDYGIKVNLTTNGTLLMKNKDVLLKAKALRQVNVSLHSFEANDNNITFNEYFNNVLSFIYEANKETNIICSMRLWNFDGEETIGQNDLNNKITEMIRDKFDYNDKLMEILNRDKRVKIRDRVYLNGAEKFQWPSMDIDPLGDSGFCHGLRDHFGILVDGTVVPCCLDGEGNIPLGNIYKEELKDILEGERARKIFEGFSGRKRVEELCKRCGYSEVFSK